MARQMAHHPSSHDLSPSRENGSKERSQHDRLRTIFDVGVGRFSQSQRRSRSWSSFHNFVARSVPFRFSESNQPVTGVWPKDSVCLLYHNRMMQKQSRGKLGWTVMMSSSQRPSTLMLFYSTLLADFRKGHARRFVSVQWPL